MREEKITADAARAALNYDPLTGIFTHAKAKSNGTLPGAVAGGDDAGGYRRVRVDGVMVRAHRLAWLIQTGRWPEKQIDHINGNRADNSWANLRLADQPDNAKNRATQKNNSLGRTGVDWRPREKRYRARIQSDGVKHDLGYFLTLDEASAAYSAASKVMHGKFSRLNSPARYTVTDEGRAIAAAYKARQEAK